MPALLVFLKKIKDSLFILSILTLVGTRITLQYTYSFSKEASSILDLIFHFFIGALLWLFYIKKYNANKLRIGFMAFFLLEFSIGIFLKKISIAYSAELTAIGLIGILIIWLNTHSNRHKFN
jgi:hypothetical protein